MTIRSSGLSLFAQRNLLVLSWACVALLMPLGMIRSQETTAHPRRIHGTVRAPDGRPLEGANVFVLETLDGVVTGTDGRFSIGAPAGTVTLVLRRLGSRELRRVMAAIDTAAINVVLEPSPVSLAQFTVQAGQYTASAERGATLTPLEVVTTPGTAADVNRAIQSLPGVQAGDEGTALFVRGGDFTETRVFLNDAALLTPVQLQSPNGTFTGSVDPFLLDGIHFSSGGFGARYGDALSGIVALRTQGRPSRNSVTATAGLAGVSGSAALRLSNRTTLRASASRTDLDPMFRLNRTMRYQPAPHGHDLSASVVTNYGSVGEINFFAIDQTNALGLGVEEASFQGNFAVQSRSTQAMLGWRDKFGSTSSVLTLAMSKNRNATDFGAFRLGTEWRHAQAFGQAEINLRDDLVVRTGGDAARLVASFDGSLPASGYNVKPGARTTVVASEQPGSRIGLFSEADWRPIDRVRVIAGLRSDQSTLTRRRTLDPRVSVALSGPLGSTVTMAWGMYHQVPDPLYYNDSLSAYGALPSMRSEQRILGVQLGGEDQILRLEAYDKRYHNLVQRTRDYDVVADGRGNAAGVDVFAKGQLGGGVSGRVSYSYVSSRRMDPDARILTRAPFDVTNSLTIIAERAVFRGIRGSAAFRHATGRPFTPVTHATHDDTDNVYVPVYGAPMSERLPPFSRLDFSASYFRPLGNGLQSVLFVSMMNLLDRDNAQRYRYNVDYTQRFLVSSLFQRSIYFGGTITWMQESR